MSVFDLVPSDPLRNPAKPSNPPSRPRIWRLDEIIEGDFPPSECFLAKDLLTKGDICLLAGRRKAGKTYLALRLVGCIAGGIPFGPYETKPGRILYFSQEISEKACHRRLRRLFQTDEYRAIAANLHLICKVPGIKLDTPEGAATILEILRSSDQPYDGFVLDALRDVKGAYKESDNDDMGDLMVRLRDDVCLPADAFCILLHHMGKPGQDGENRGGRGASVIEDVVTEAIYVERVKGSNDRRGTFAITREGDLEGKGFTYTIAEDPDTKAVSVSVTESMEGDGNTTDEDLDIRKIADWICDQPFDVSAADVKLKFGFEKSSAYTKLRRAVNLGLITKKGTKWGPKP